MKTLFSNLLILAMCIGLLAGCNPNEKNGEQDIVTPSPPKTAAQSEPAPSRESSGQKDTESSTAKPTEQAPSPERTRVDWPVFRGNPASTGYTPESAPNTLEVLWQFKVENGAFESTPVIVDGIVFIGDLDNRVFALDLESGNLLWEFTTEIGFYAAPAVQDGRVFIGNMDGFFYCLDAHDGKLIWTFEAAATIDGG
ncbi:MAG: PQQ-like beta-propeller repeat protein, partial [Planctomycetaceae bacterium]|nr:PQQ-like beta-propeller repeat protein [Planctomycetaceae bacterium]